MSEQNGQENENEGVRNLRERLQELEAQLEKSESEKQELRRKDVFREAGVPTDGVGKLFAKSFDGDLTVEAVQAAMDEYGIKTGESTSTPEPTTPPARDPSEVAAAAAFDAAAAGQNGETPEQSPEERATRAYEETFEATGGHDIKAQAAFLRTLIEDENQKVKARK